VVQEYYNWLHTSVSYGGGFVNKIKRAILEVFVLLLKSYSFLYMKSIHFSKAEKARNKMKVKKCIHTPSLSNSDHVGIFSVPYRIFFKNS